MAIAFVSISQLFRGNQNLIDRVFPLLVLLRNRKKSTLILTVIVFLSVSAPLPT